MQTRKVSRMDEYESLSHTKWECKYHLVFIPKCRRRTLHAKLREHSRDAHLLWGPIGQPPQNNTGALRRV